MPKKSLVVVVGGRPILVLAQVQVFCPGQGQGQDLTGNGPGLDLDLTWDLEWDLDLSLTINNKCNSYPLFSAKTSMSLRLSIMVVFWTLFIVVWIM